VKVTSPIQEWIHKPIPQTLWHYTSINGLQGILENGNIRATDIRFMNDREEVVHARKIAQKLIDEYPDKDADGFDARKAFGLIVDDIFNPTAGLFSPEFLSCHVASFSNKKDNLSQWRGYSYETVGASLGFNITRIQKPTLEFDFDWFKQKTESGFPVIFAPCVYIDAEKKKLLHQALNSILDVLKKVYIDHPETREMMANPPKNKGIVDAIWELLKKLHSTNKNQFTNAMCQAIGYLLLIVALLKNVAFEEEDEWRLVIWFNAVTKAIQYPRRFRAEKTALIPYLEFPLGKGTEIRIDLNDLVLGPGSDRHTISAAKSFLKSIGVELSPSPSGVPYRPK